LIGAGLAGLAEVSDQLERRGEPFQE